MGVFFEFIVGKKTVGVFFAPDFFRHTRNVKKSFGMFRPFFLAMIV